MKKFLTSRDFKVSIGLALVGLLAGVSVAMWQLSDPALSKAIPGNVSKEVIIAVAAIQIMITTFILSIIGIKLSKRVGLKLHSEFKSKDTLLMIIVSGLTSFILIASDKFVFARYLGEYANTKFHLNFMELVASVFYGGVIEEVMLRLFAVSLLVFILYKIFARKSSTSDIPGWIYIAAIFIAAMLFAAGHLPATKTIFGLTTPIVIRCFLLNGLGGMIFGYYYWKKGLTMAIASHMAVHLFRLFIFMPLFY